MPSEKFELTIKQPSHDWAAIQTHLNNEVRAVIPGIILHLEQPDAKISQDWTAGLADQITGTPLKAEMQFRIASVTKTFVACAMLRLWENGRLGLDDSIGGYISEAHTNLLGQGGYRVEQLTLRRILQHSSGLFDHTNSPAFLPALLQTPAHIWTRSEQLEMAVRDGRPIGPPGAQFSYSDTGYILLGEVLERVTGQDLGAALHNLLNFARLGLNSTWMETEQDATSERRIHQYYQGIDTYHFSPSMDLYGGGGLLSTCRDLSVFFLALFNGQVFHNPATLQTMLEPVAYAQPPDKDYRLGIWKTEIAGQPVFTHTGFWGIQVLYLPGINASAAVCYSQTWPVKGNAPAMASLIQHLTQNTGREFR